MDLLLRLLGVDPKSYVAATREMGQRTLVVSAAALALAVYSSNDRRATTASAVATVGLLGVLLGTASLKAVNYAEEQNDAD